MNERHQFRTLSSRTVYEGAILALRLDRVAMPGGSDAEREVIEHHGAVAIAALDDNDRLIMIRQYRHPVAARLLELPAGLLDEPDEDPLAAAKRELLEETGLAADDWSVLVDLVSSPGFTDEAVRVYLARELTESERPEARDEEADLELVRLALPDAVESTLNGEIVNATAVSGVLSLAAARATGVDLRPADAPWPGQPTTFARRKAESQHDAG